MNSAYYKTIDLNKLAVLCSLYKPGDEYWYACSKFCLSLRGVPWGQLTHKQVNWLQRIIEEADPGNQAIL